MSKVYGNATVFDNPMPDIVGETTATIASTPTPTHPSFLSSKMFMISGIVLLAIVVITLVVIYQDSILKVLYPQKISPSAEKAPVNKSNINDIVKEVEANRIEHPEVEHDMYLNKKGWCNTGSDRGYRSCVYVSENDACMSKKIYPTRDICIHPSLRV